MYFYSYLGEIGLKLATIAIEFTEVATCFTIPFEQLQTMSQWTVREYSAPFFTPITPLEEGVIWGLTGYILDTCLHQVILPYVRSTRQK